MSSFEAVLDQFERKRVLVVGDVMLDRFVYGHVSRISPEAPAPVIETSGPVDVVGGSGNVVRNIVSLGAACEIVAVVGCDDQQIIRPQLRQHARQSPVERFEVPRVAVDVVAVAELRVEIDQVCEDQPSIGGP